MRCGAGVTCIERIEDKNDEGSFRLHAAFLEYDAPFLDFFLQMRSGFLRRAGYDFDAAITPALSRIRRLQARAHFVRYLIDDCARRRRGRREYMPGREFIAGQSRLCKGG